MAVVKQQYTVAATWTPSSFATQLRQAFIDDGLMSEWYDSFADSGIEHRVLEVIYDGAKAYGKTYYWFKFETSLGVSVTAASGWNIGTHVPTGTQYADYFSTVKNSVSNDTSMFYSDGGAPTTSGDVTITRFTGTKQTWFLLKQSTKISVFSIVKPARTIAAALNLDYGCFGGMMTTSGEAYSVRFRTYPLIRRMINAGFAVYDQIQGYQFHRHDHMPILFEAGQAVVYGLQLPWASSLASCSPGLPVSHYCPVYHSLPVNPFVTDIADPDFGICPLSLSSVAIAGDTITIAAGVEVWEIIRSSQFGHLPPIYPKTYQVVRTT